MALWELTVHVALARPDELHADSYSDRDGEASGAATNKLLQRRRRVSVIFHDHHHTASLHPTPTSFCMTYTRYTELPPPIIFVSGELGSGYPQALPLSVVRMRSD